MELATSLTQVWRGKSTLLNKSRPESRLRRRRCGRTSALTVFIAYASTLSYEIEEVEYFYLQLEEFYRDGHTFYKAIVGDFNAKIGPKKAPEEVHIGTHGVQWNEQGEALRVHHDDQDHPWELSTPGALLMGATQWRVTLTSSVERRTSD
ncbi:hypothetical protein RB195_016086 [Necator americanus]|uniref:Endonuclease/exonuclease/phosphatase domain-containing protein n=1 Tax=Necator americanus TaxID=51031 RepID=A0ABR1E7H6_NECAM